MHHGEKSKPSKSSVDLAKQAGMTEAELRRLKSTYAEAVLTLKPLEKVYFPDGKGGLREERIPAGFKDPMGDAMTRAFKHFNLDPEDPGSWALLVSYFAFVFFWRSPRTRGAQKKWTAEREAQLFDAVRDLRGYSDIAAAKRLANDKRSPFFVPGEASTDGVRGLRKKIGEVRRKLKTN